MPDRLPAVAPHWLVPPPPGPQGFFPELWILGQPPLGDFLDFVRDSTPEGEAANGRDAYALWRAASDRYFELREDEAGEAEAVEILSLADAMVPLAAAAEESPAFRAVFAHLPYRFAMVELDRMVVFQRLVRLPQVEALRADLAVATEPEALFRACHPVGRAPPPIEVRRHGSRRYLVTAEATDLRFQGATLLDPARFVASLGENRRGGSGPVGAAIALSVGFGANFLNLLESDGRLVLQNGYHRAVALRSLGHTHAPCVVQILAQREELNLVGASPLIEDPIRWFRSPRPPLLRDFFDPALSRVFMARRPRRAVEVSFDVREFDLTD